MTQAPTPEGPHARVVWVDDWFRLTTCPVLEKTPEVGELLEWFERTHTLQVGFGAAMWQRTSLPAGGGVTDQEARLMDALEWIRKVKNASLQDTPARRRRGTQQARDEGDES